MIVIVDYGMGNLGSVKNMLKKVGAESCISSDNNVIRNATRLILPGVGSFDNGMKNLEDRGMVELLKEKVVKNRTPVLGICLGMQLMTSKSEEGTLPGLSWVDAETIKFKFDPGMAASLKIPHMGWNEAAISKKHPLLAGLESDARFYFVHSYHARCNNPDDVLTCTEHGYKFTSSFQHDNIIGVQFHPEKSHKFGLQLLKNFAEL